ncbi:MAG: F0F1 ATP synthase subunit A [Cytophagaceae bacterium]|nr:F0F1 ATP synthase subunit A [Cytophagaceae bacterium]MDW8457191.1 F0F1 ATP synthase subunit A [Cytophagaceae bacterium]
MQTLTKYILLISFLFITTTSILSAGDNKKENSEEEFDAGELIMHHISDSHEWHWFDIGDERYITPLPVILYSKEYGLDIFLSNKFPNLVESEYSHYVVHHDKIHAKDETVHVWDISITKNVVSILVSVILLFSIFLTIAARYRRNPLVAPKGLQSFFEPIIVFIRDDIAKKVIGEKKYRFYMPYLLTVFFFIWFNNLLGLLPAGANVTGNIAVTMCLALFTFIITNLSGNAHYWKHIFWTPGVPLPLRIIILPIEIVGIFTKPFSLMIRLFANITAGHIIILSFIALIFIFKTIFIAPVSIAFGLFMSFLELFVAILQAYVFTLLSAMYIGAAVEEHGHHDEHH